MCRCTPQSAKLLKILHKSIGFGDKSVYAAKCKLLKILEESAGFAASVGLQAIIAKIPISV